jgi:hypothetical protein
MVIEPPVEPDDCKNWGRIRSMKTQSVLVAATLFVTVGVAFAQNEPSQDTMRAPTGFQSTAPNNPPVSTVPEAATDAPRAPSPQTTGEAPNVSRKMGAEMNSAGDPKASPDEE